MSKLWSDFYSNCPLLVLVVILMVGAAYSQTTGTILGTVQDETGAVLPGATVTLTNAETGFTRTLVTNDQGRYRAPNLPLGDYQVTGALDGFKTFNRTGIVLTVGREAVVNLTLQVGDVFEEVTVRGEGVLVSTTSATIENLVDEKKVRDLPLNGRDYLQLTALQPGVSITKTQRTGVNPQTGTGLQLSISGGRPNQNAFVYDGVVVNDHANSSPGSTTGANLGVEALQEFSVLTNTYSAEHGRSAGGVINAVTRSGTNEYHGSLFYFHRNDNLDARNFFDPGDVPEFRRHQFGATGGGPIVKDKTFIFGNYEGLREFLATTQTSTVLSPAARMGNLTTGQVQIDPAVQPFVELYPLPNGPVSGDTGLFATAPGRDSEEDYFIIRADHIASDSVSMNGSYTFDDAAVFSPDQLLFNDEISPSRRQFIAYQLNWVINPAVVYNMNFGYNRSNVETGITSTRKPGLEDPQVSFLPGQPAGQIAVRGLSDFTGGEGTLDPDAFLFESTQTRHNVTWTVGNHTLRFGGSGEFIGDRAISEQARNGEFDFASIEDFLTRKPDVFTAQIPGSDGIRNFRQQVFGVYFQDDIRVRPNLTLNLGFRYEFASDPSEINAKEAFLPGIDATEVRTGEFFSTPKKNFGPRVGFAWDVFGSGKTAIRGGFGIFYDLPLTNMLTIPALRIPPFFQRASSSDLEPTDFPSGAIDKLAQVEIGILDADSVQNELDSAYQMQYNLNIQHELFRNTVVTVGYVGARGVHLSRIGEDMNLAVPVVRDDGRLFFPAGQEKRNPNFGRIRFWMSDASSFYNALQVGVNRRFTEAFRIQGSYTWSKSVDDWSTTFSSNQFRNSIANPFPFIRELNRGRSDFNVGQNIVINGTWDVPFRLDGAAGKFLNGWQVSGIFNGQDGLAITPSVGGGDPARTLTLRRGRRSGQRPDVMPGVDTAGGALVTGDPNQWIDPSGFAFPEAGVLGNLGRGTVNGPGFIGFDLNVVKRTQISERASVEFRFEAFNLFNRANFDIPADTRREVFDSSGNVLENFGQITNTVGTSRELQFGIKVLF